MKHIIRRFVLSAALLSSAFIANAQKAFEGSIVYTIDISGESLTPEMKQMMAGSQMSVYMKGEKSRTDMNMAMQNTITISDAKAKSSFVLMDIMGQKYKIVTKDDAKKPEITVKELTDTKEVAGYKCKKAELSTTGQEPITVYYTEDIPNTGYNTQIKGIKGYPLEFEVTQGGMKINYSAKSVSKEKIEDAKFVVDDKDYKVMTKEELMKSMGGGQ
jgi:GLPGLI family protein